MVVSRHLSQQDITADLLKEVCTDVTVEPSLQPLTGEVLDMRTSISGEEARLDIYARGFLGSRFEWAFFDVRHPSIPTNQSQQMTAIYCRHEQENHRAYEQQIREMDACVYSGSGITLLEEKKAKERIAELFATIHHDCMVQNQPKGMRVLFERASFTSLVFTTSGGMGKAATILYKQLAGLVAQKRHQPYSTTIGWLRTALSFALLRSAVLCLRGSRARRSPPVSSDHALDLMVSKGHLG